MSPLRILPPFMRLAVLGLWICVAGCRPAQDTPQVVIYVSADEYVARPILEQFEQETGISVQALYDTEATKTTGLVSRIIAEAARPRADLFWSSECFRMIELQQGGLLGQFPPDQVRVMNEGVPANWCSSADAWVAIAPRARVIVYAPDRVAADARPTDWEDLADSRWKGRLAMADPRFGTTGGHLGAMYVAWGPERYGRWIDGLVANDVSVLSSGNAGVVEGIASGEFDVGMTDTDDVWAARARGLSVELIYPRHEPPPVAGGGTLLIPNTIGLIKGGPHPQSARVLASWLASPQAERRLMESPSRNIPLRGDPGDLAVPDPLQVELEQASVQRAKALEAARSRGLLEAS